MCALRACWQRNRGVRQWYGPLWLPPAACRTSEAILWPSNGKAAVLLICALLGCCCSGVYLRLLLLPQHSPLCGVGIDSLIG